MNNMFKVFFPTCWIGVIIYYNCRILGICNKVIKANVNKVIKANVKSLASVILEGYLSIYILQNRCFFISVNKADTACQ